MVRIEDVDLEVEDEYYNIVKEMLFNKTVLKMRDIPHQGSCNCYDHCIRASYYCYKVCKKLGLDYVSCARAAMVHDLYLYNWREGRGDRKGLHAFTHPKLAYENAAKLFDLNEKEKDIIIKHMWPLTIIPPKYAEGFVLTMVDKYCATLENFQSLSEKKAWRYAYLLLCLLFIKR